MAGSKEPEEFIAGIRTLDDGLPTRKANRWSRDKLGILSMYLPRFALACSKKAPEFYFVDGLAGEGVYSFAETGEFLLGSTLIALQEPTHPYARVVSMDLSQSKVAALQQRAAGYGDRALIQRGDCNSDLLPLMRESVNPKAPVLVFLDPAGFELKWDTVAQVAAFRDSDRFRTELLVFVPSNSVGRVAGFGDDLEDPGVDPPDDVFPPNSDWRRIWLGRRERWLTPEQARSEFAEDYRKGVEKLGYAFTATRAITGSGPEGTSRYHLVFASDNEAGITIMEHCFRRMYTVPAAKEKRKVPKEQMAFDSNLFQ